MRKNTISDTILINAIMLSGHGIMKNYNQYIVNISHAPINKFWSRICGAWSDPI